MHNINPITQETFENSQSKAIQRFRWSEETAGY
jgi:hypothetical protein